MDAVKGKLGELKQIKRLSENPLLKYEILDKKGSNSLLEISDTYISLRFFFAEQDIAVYKNNMIVFISLIAFLKEHYDFDFEDIYGYIVGALNQNFKNVRKDQTTALEGLKDRVKSLNESNSLLSYQIIELSLENSKLLKERDLYREFSGSVIAKVSERAGSRSQEDYSILDSLGIDLELTKRVENCLTIGKG